MTIIKHSRKRPAETAGMCIGCLTPTDTVLGFRGDGEFIIAAVAKITGDALELAHETYRQATGAKPGCVIDGINDVVFRVCEPCAAKAGLPAKPVLFTPLAEIPTFSPLKTY